jgi:hypothetical protein
MKHKNANYDFARQKEPEVPMGHGSFANMPTDVMMRSFSKTNDYRDGIVNGFTTALEDISHIAENQR